MDRKKYADEVTWSYKILLNSVQCHEDKCQWTVPVRQLISHKNFAKPHYVCVEEIFGETNFHQYGKGCHIL
jgi:hypothetical protein